jgi:hypothetical protein
MDKCVLKHERLPCVLAKTPVFRMTRSDNSAIDILLKLDDEPLRPSWGLNHDIICNLKHVFTSIVIRSLEEMVPDMRRCMMTIVNNHFGSRHSVLVGEKEGVVTVNPNVEAVLYGWALRSLKRGKKSLGQVTFIVRCPRLIATANGNKNANFHYNGIQSTSLNGIVTFAGLLSENDA